MIRGKRVVVFTPWGRELTASILFRYLERDWHAGVVDEWMICMNIDPDQHMDRDYAHRLAAEHEWINVYDRPPGEVLWPKQMNTGKFYQYMQDDGTVYVRMDDDIVWIEDHAVERLVEQRLDNPMPFVVFPIIWNNAVCSHYLQQMSIIPEEWGTVTNHCMDYYGWRDVNFAVNMHEYLLDAIEDDDVRKCFMHHSIQLPVGHQFSVSCFAQSGTEYSKVDGILGGEEEGWHTIKKPYELQRPNLIVPNALVSHFSFYHQRDFLINYTNILDRYRRLSLNV